MRLVLQGLVEGYSFTPGRHGLKSALEGAGIWSGCLEVTVRLTRWVHDGCDDSTVWLDVTGGLVSHPGGRSVNAGRLKSNRRGSGPSVLHPCPAGSVLNRCVRRGGVEAYGNRCGESGVRAVTLRLRLASGGRARKPRRMAGWRARNISAVSVRAESTAALTDGTSPRSSLHLLSVGALCGQRLSARIPCG